MIRQTVRKPITWVLVGAGLLTLILIVTSDLLFFLPGRLILPLGNGQLRPSKLSIQVSNLLSSSVNLLP